MGDSSHCHKLFTILFFWGLVNSASASADSRRVDKHPLAEINIYNTTLALRDSVAIRASPFVLGSKIKISFFKCQESSSTCPAVNNKDKEPYLCTSPIKFKYTNSSKSYSKTGKAVLKFQLINQRADFSFALFSGGLSNGEDAEWVTVYLINPNPSADDWVAVFSPAKFNVEGISQRLLLWCIRYTYKMGHRIRLSDGSFIWSKIYSFRSSPYPGHDSLQRVLIMGDLGKAERDGSNEYADYQPGSLNTTDQLIKDLDNIDIVFHIGDLAYANGYISQWDQFVSQVEPIASAVPYMVASGNHERTWPDSGGFYQGTDSGGECGVTAETLFYVPAENRAKFWYSTDYGMFRFCIADSEHDWREGSEQYKFLERCLASADRRKQPWLIFAAHRPFGYSSNEWFAEEGAYEEPMGRDDLQKLWQKYRVDIAFFGHVHNYERTCPIYQNTCVKSGTSHYSGVVNGTIHIVTGGGGSHLSAFATEIPNWSLFRDYDFGYTKLTAFNHSSLLFEHMKSSDGKVYDSFTISREYMDVLACVHDSCAPSTLAA
ncbi:putative inactive purple acid phosphatase 24 [Morella rubra]|uniref:Putative inactive purple acid phosphatase 24 n=1 Tax=Morella rubra TaxID=262757 RepID=A0A6A1W3P8_9ROSI|nr:putative inactive purple acid phosphatase 24 [Morella rubra]